SRIRQNAGARPANARILANAATLIATSETFPRSFRNRFDPESPQSIQPMKPDGLHFRRSHGTTRLVL
ncbi:MAG: hypothetical protein JWN70_5560, partial [Planctomycetaceae bacterium]|nr:hypothetical protein [Planctomycetaceae bacterium]